MKNIFYFIYALVFYIYSIFPINDNKTTFIMTHDISINGNIMCMYKKLIKRQPNHSCKFITKVKFKNKVQKVLANIKFIFISPYNLATSKYIFLDNTFLPMAYIKFNKRVKIVQMWHGCNTIKKFGQLSNTGTLKKLEKRANSRYTHVIVSSKKMIDLHKNAFGVERNVLYPLGLPRMDIFFDDNRKQLEIDALISEFGWLKDKVVILYAPTFRDNNLSSLDPRMDLSDIANKLPENYIIIYKFHPFISKRYKIKESSKIINFSEYKDLTRLLLISDMLITDYSSIMFDYALLNRPILYYAYDEYEYENEIRGFYYDYNQYISGKIINSKNELLNKILNTKLKKVNMEKFISRYIDKNNVNSVDKIYEEIYLKDT